MCGGDSIRFGQYGRARHRIHIGHEPAERNTRICNRLHRLRRGVLPLTLSGSQATLYYNATGAVANLANSISNTVGAQPSISPCHRRRRRAKPDLFGGSVRSERQPLARRTPRGITVGQSSPSYRINLPTAAGSTLIVTLAVVSGSATIACSNEQLGQTTAKFNRARFSQSVHA